MSLPLLSSFAGQAKQEGRVYKLAKNPRMKGFLLLVSEKVLPSLFFMMME